MHGNGIVIRNIRQADGMVKSDIDIEQKICNALKDGDVLIYGAHLVAIELYRYLKSISERLGLYFSFAGFVVTDRKSVV